jgi:hypothetical protein
VLSLATRRPLTPLFLPRLIAAPGARPLPRAWGSLFGVAVRLPRGHTGGVELPPLSEYLVFRRKMAREEF